MKTSYIKCNAKRVNILCNFQVSNAVNLMLSKSEHRTLTFECLLNWLQCLINIKCVQLSADKQYFNGMLNNRRDILTVV